MRIILFRLVTFAVLSFASVAAFAQHHSQLCSARFFVHPDSISNTLDFMAGASGNTVSYAWDFGDGSTGSARMEQHTYAATGTYYVCLTVTRTDSAGTVLCTDSHCDSVRVGSVTPPAPSPVCNARFRYRSSMGGSSVRFFGGRSSGAMTTTYSWDFGDGTTDTLRNPLHAFPATGSYYVCLTLTAYDSLGNVACTDNWCDSVSVGLVHHPGGCSSFFGTSHHHRLSGTNGQNTAAVTVYPNPMVDKAVLRLEGFNGPVSFLVFNRNGQVVLENSVLSDGEFSLDKILLPSGIYFYQATGTDQVVTGKLLVQ
ncbi:MAG: hypothetical protein RL021_1525 [Bacteroidota bacterium]